MPKDRVVKHLGAENICTQIRLDENTFKKGKVLAAIYDESFNKFMLRAIRNEIQKYETEHGELPKMVVPDVERRI